MNQYTQVHNYTLVYTVMQLYTGAHGNIPVYIEVYISIHKYTPGYLGGCLFTVNGALQYSNLAATCLRLRSPFQE